MGNDITNNQEFCPQHGYPLPCSKCSYQPSQLVPSPELLTDVIKAIDELLSVSSYSEGIAGWHLNGEILKWEQCEFIQPLSELLPKLKEFQENDLDFVKEKEKHDVVNTETGKLQGESLNENQQIAQNG